MALADAVSRLRPDAGRPPFLDDAAGGILAVGRRLYDDPETVTLPDGRTLGYARTGDPEGTPVLAFHGIPSGRLGAAVYDRVATDHGVQLIAPERPGVGVSDPAPDRDLADWPTDAAGLLDALDIETAPVLGISGGGPYALACGATAPDRFPRVALCCPAGPFAAAGLRVRSLGLLARYGPRVLGAFLSAEILSSRHAPARTIERRIAASAPADEPVWRGELGKLLVASGPAATERHGTASFVRDLQLFTGDWGFDRGAIDVPVGIWHGRADRINPIAMGLALWEAIPTAEAHFHPDHGHVGIIPATEEAIFTWVGPG